MSRSLITVLALVLIFFGSAPATAAESTGIVLTEEEQAWLSAHPIIRLGVDPAWAPIDFVDPSGRHQGIADDYLRLLSQRLGITIELVEGLTWTEVLERAWARDLDLVSLAAATPERRDYLRYTESVVSSAWVVIVRKGDSAVAGLQELEGREVGLVKGYSITDLAKTRYPGFPFTEVDTPLEGLRMVSTGRLDAFVENLDVAEHLIIENELVNLRIAGDAGFDVLKLRFGIRSDWPQLVMILNKALANVSKKEAEAIRYRWVPESAPPSWAA